jgi:hypothetical protein
VWVVHENGNHFYPCIAGLQENEEKEEENKGVPPQRHQEEAKAIQEGKGFGEFITRIKALREEAEKVTISSTWLGEAWARPFMENFFDRLAHKFEYTTRGLARPLEVVKLAFKGLRTVVFQKGVAQTGGKDKLTFHFDTKEDYLAMVERRGEVPRQSRIVPVFPRLRMAEVERELCWKDADLNILRIRKLPWQINKVYTSDIIRQAFQIEDPIAPLEVRTVVGTTKIYLYREAHREKIKSVLQKIVIDGRQIFKPSMFMEEGEQGTTGRHRCNLCLKEEGGHRTEDCPEFFWVFVELKECRNLGSLMKLGDSLMATRVVMAGSIVAPLPWDEIQLGKKVFFIYKQNDLTSLEKIQKLYESWARTGYSLRDSIQNIFISLEKKGQGWIKSLTDLFEEINTEAGGTGNSPPKARGTGLTVCFDKFDKGVCLKMECQSCTPKVKSGEAENTANNQRKETVCLDFRRPRFGTQVGGCRFGKDCFFAHSRGIERDTRDLHEVRKRLNMCLNMENAKGQYRLCRDTKCTKSHNPWQEEKQTVKDQRVREQMEGRGFREGGGTEECVFEDKATKQEVVIASKYERTLFDSAGGAVVEVDEGDLNQEVRQKLESERPLAGEQGYFLQFRYRDTKNGNSFVLLQQRKKFDALKRDFKIFIPIGGAKTTLDCRPGKWYLLPQLWNFNARRRKNGPGEVAQS